jgi:hypothetical protein
MGKVKGTMLDLTGDNLELFPIAIKSLDAETLKKLEGMVDQMQALVSGAIKAEQVLESTEYKDLYEQIDDFVFDCYGLSVEEKVALKEEVKNLTSE